MATADERVERLVRAALQDDVARRLVLRLEHQGRALRVRDGRLVRHPRTGQLELDQLYRHGRAVLVLVEHRARWADWFMKPMPTFHPRRAFLPTRERKTA